MHRQQVFIIGFGIIAALTLVAVVVVSGTPGQVRQKKFDDQRVSDLRQIESGITNLARTKISQDYLKGITFSSDPYIPISLAVLDNPNAGSFYLYDPVTKQPYEYKATGEKSYQLCATFATANDQVASQVPAAERLWLHPIGSHCFDLTIDVDRLQAEMDYFEKTFKSYIAPPAPLPQ